QAAVLREVARRAGVTHAAPYRHFPDKEALLAEVAEEGFRAFSKAVREARDAAGSDPVARFQAAGRGYLRFALAHRGHFRVMFGAVTFARSRHPGLAEAGAEAFQILLDTIGACQAAGRFKSGDPLAWAVAAWAAVHGAAILLLNGQLEIVRAFSATNVE